MMLEQSDREYKVTMINVLKALVKKMDNMHKQMGNFFPIAERWKL